MLQHLIEWLVFCEIIPCSRVHCIHAIVELQSTAKQIFRLCDKLNFKGEEKVNKWIDNQRLPFGSCRTPWRSEQPSLKTLLVALQRWSSYSWVENRNGQLLQICIIFSVHIWHGWKKTAFCKGFHIPTLQQSRLSDYKRFHSLAYW